MLLTMSDKELNRVNAIKDVCERRLKQKDAAASLGITRRQVQRLVNQYRQHGAAGLISQRRNKPSNRRLDPQLKSRVLSIIHERYLDFGPTFANEKLREHHGFKLSTETLRQWMISDGLWIPKIKRVAKAHPPRMRRECFGELIQIDGSHHDWFEGRADKCCLIVYIDDATGRLTALEFTEVESTYDYMNITRRHLEQHGKPVAFYSDKHSVFKVNHPEALTGTHTTQFGRALHELNIELICANSPQAKGRVERVNYTLQDRLIKEMRLAGISSIEAANQWLPTFIEDFNQRFSREPYSLIDAHRPLRESAAELDDIFSRQMTRTVSQSLTLQYEKVIYLLENTPETTRLIGKKVMVHNYPDGTIDIKHCGKSLKVTVHDKLRTVNEAVIVNSKQLDTTLKRAKISQEKRELEKEGNKSDKDFHLSTQNFDFKVTRRFTEQIKPDR